MTDTVPNNSEIERAVIGETFVNKALSFEARALSTADFFAADHRQIWSVICEIDEDGEPLEILEIHNRLKRQFPQTETKVSELANFTLGIPEGTNFAKNVQALKLLSTLRYLQKSFSKLSEKAERRQPLEDLISETESLIRSVKETSEREKGTAKSFAQVIQTDVIPRLDKFVSGEAVKISFGFDRLDASTGGGAGLGELIILGAKPKSGKSAMMIQIANSVAQSGTGTYVCSREMLNFENAFRIIAQNSKYTMNHFRPNLYQSTRDQIVSDAIAVSDAPLYLDDKAKSCADIRREILRLADEGVKIPAVFVDYIQLMKADNLQRFNSKADVLEDIIYALKDLSVELEAAVFTNAQFNRDGIDSPKPKMSDFAGSSAIEKAGNLILLWQIEPEISSISGGRNGQLWIEAGRNVPYDSFDICFYGERALFTFP